METKLGSKAFDLGERQGFGKCISHYLSGRTIGESDPPILNDSSNEVEMDINVLQMGMVLAVFGEENDRSVVQK